MFYKIRIVGIIGLDVKERLAIAIKQIVEKNGASFAFPSQSIYIEKK
jgi:MscS family membrane protein